MDDVRLRKTVIELLEGGHAHLTTRQALAGLRAESRDRRPAPGLHTVYEELEHMRIAQEDILRYTLDEHWRSPAWPQEYWPGEGRSLTEERWNGTVKGFFSDLDEAIRLVRDTGRDLTAEIPHGEGRTYLRQALLIADHNAFHGGQIVTIRKALGDWDR